MARVRLVTTAVVALVASLTATERASAPPWVFDLGVTINKGELVQPGNVFYTTGMGSSILIDQDGAKLHEWRHDGFSIDYAKPLPNGTILARVSQSDQEPYEALVELDRNSKVLWSYVVPAELDFHHDHELLPDDTFLLLCSKTIDRPTISDKPLEDDCLLQVDRDGKVLWEWQTADHFDDFDFPQHVKDGIFEDGGDWAHANAAVTIPEDTLHTDPRFRPGNILISYRFISMVVIVDRDTGDIVWVDVNSIGQHDSKMLPTALPQTCAEGQTLCNNILVFDNGLGDHYTRNRGRRASRVIEIDPVTQEVIWDYDAEDSGRPAWFFDSWFISGAERMPNGNTLIDEGAFGRVFEVKPDGEIVWEYVNPVFNTSLSPPRNTIYRAHKVPPDW